MKRTETETHIDEDIQEVKAARVWLLLFRVRSARPLHISHVEAPATQHRHEEVRQMQQRRAEDLLRHVEEPDLQGPPGMLPPTLYHEGGHGEETQSALYEERVGAEKVAFVVVVLHGALIRLGGGFGVVGVLSVLWRPGVGELVVRQIRRSFFHIFVFLRFYLARSGVLSITGLHNRGPRRYGRDLNNRRPLRDTELLRLHALDANKLSLKNQRRTSWNTSRAPRTIAHLRRNRQSSTLSDAHIYEPFVPAHDHFAGAQLECKRYAALVALVKLCAIAR
jgi:hypothetical protein